MTKHLLEAIRANSIEFGQSGAEQTSQKLRTGDSYRQVAVRKIIQNYLVD